MQKKLNQYIKIAAAANMLGVSQNTLRAWADDGRIPVMINPANGYRLFRQEDLEAFLNQAAQPVLREQKHRSARSSI